jgi:hypothetical protein
MEAVVRYINKVQEKQLDAVAIAFVPEHLSPHPDCRVQSAMGGDSRRRKANFGHCRKKPGGARL